jgi:hypothetical protein
MYYYSCSVFTEIHCRPYLVYYVIVRLISLSTVVQVDSS